MDTIERAKELFRVLEARDRSNRSEAAIRAFTIQEKLAEIRKV